MNGYVRPTVECRYCGKKLKPAEEVRCSFENFVKGNVVREYRVVCPPCARHIIGYIDWRSRAKVSDDTK